MSQPIECLRRVRKSKVIAKGVKADNIPSAGSFIHVKRPSSIIVARRHRIVRTKFICTNKTVITAFKKAAFAEFIKVFAFSFLLVSGQAFGDTFKEPSNIFAPVSAQKQLLPEKMKQLVKELRYSENTADDFVRMVINWKDKQDKSFLVSTMEELEEAEHNFTEGRLSRGEYVKIQKSTVRRLADRIKKEISFSKEFYELDDIIRHKKTQCLGYSQLFYLLGNATGLSVEAINVAERSVQEPSDEIKGHMSCIVNLADGQTVMVDLVPDGFISMTFSMEQEYLKEGDYGIRKAEDNYFTVDRKIQILDKDGIAAQIENNRAYRYYNVGQYAEAISYYNRAVELNPRYAEAYNNRGIALAKLGRLDEALASYNTAIEINSGFVEAYYNRGVANMKSGSYAEALSDFSKTIELNPEHTMAYNNRGALYIRLGQYTKTISDCTRALELNPRYAKTYNNRGLAEAFMGRSEAAKKDLRKAVELNPSLKSHVGIISEQFNLNVEPD
jgi:tetratricopeptide (TPR) repeat protein